MNHLSSEAASGRARAAPLDSLNGGFSLGVAAAVGLGLLAAVAALATPGRVLQASNGPEQGAVPASPPPTVVPTPTETTPTRSSS